MPPDVAATVGDMMRKVVNDPNGTGTAAQIDGRDRRRQDRNGPERRARAPCKPHAWFIAFAPAEAPQSRSR